ncbi:gp436 family protein [Marinobacterium stanieri]|uniref:Mu-like prophage protein gp36 n=1 Tax=Marinobacterium stanieri TaxID=49186 RepID=A0A1N6RQ00_9GAMM|nr:DUF1320 domain-containing protein [Marinobacterium stanieri]SIQ30877.1 Mu-like prophage protein gp36 [Marinobacterium stanieri]
MSYITHEQLAKRPGVRELAQVATPEHESIVDSELMEATLTGADRSAWSIEDIEVADEALSAIEDAMVDAKSVIDGFLSRRGYLPLTSVPPIVNTWARVIVRYMLHKDRIGDSKDDPIVRDYQDAMKLLQLTADGKFSLGADDPTQSNGADLDVQFMSDGRVFGRGLV